MQEEVVDEDGQNEVKVHREREKTKDFGKKGGKKKILKRKEFVMKKKDRLRRRGLATKTDSKYTGRRRKPKF
jgi:18S rRNA (guanine1575-N7)-methyltransferase